MRPAPAKPKHKGVDMYYNEQCEHGHSQCSDTSGGPCSCMEWDERADRVARNFQAVLSEMLMPEELGKVRALNAAEPSLSVCHSHDFCDTDEAMREAFARSGEDMREDDGLRDVALDLSLEFLGRQPDTREV